MRGMVARSASYHCALIHMQAAEVHVVVFHTAPSVAPDRAMYGRHALVSWPRVDTGV